MSDVESIEEDSPLSSEESELSVDMLVLLDGLFVVAASFFGAQEDKSTEADKTKTRADKVNNIFFINTVKAKASSPFINLTYKL